MLRSKVLQAMRLLSFALAVSGLVTLCGGESLGEDVVRIVSKQSDKDRRGDYKVTLLNAILGHTTPEFGSYRIVNVEPITRKRGFAEMLIMEDFELVRRLARSGRIVISKKAVTTSARRWKRIGLLRTTLLNWAIVLAYGCGVSPRRLAGWYRRHVVSEPVGQARAVPGGEPISASRPASDRTDSSQTA